ncbi:MAG: hypothetical protein IPH89_01945 [Bacteroidetes bacterium]|nr:hypothetical protein [Bacteroidota bacterium]
MRSFIAILVAFVFLFQSASKLLIMADYEMNKEYIAKNLCENKEKPKSTCNGKCHLAKELKKQDKKENQTSNSQKEKYENQFYSEVEKSDIINTDLTNNQLVVFYQLTNYAYYLDSIFQPPRA